MESDDEVEDVSETVEELRTRLSHLKKMMQEESGNTLGDIAAKKKKLRWDFIDGDILAVAFCLALVVVISVSVYAFFHLYLAVLKKFPSRHTEL
uniref:Uncharacterized protein n=1 Tax=Bracon brevicornis TaxID=1563983 RepID=A0A6V7K9N7_9HYME